MSDLAELKRLLSLVREAQYNSIEGLQEFRDLLRSPSHAQVCAFLETERRQLEGKRLGAIAFALAEHYSQVGDIECIRGLAADENPIVREWALDGLCVVRPANPQVGQGIVDLAIKASGDSSWCVRVWSPTILKEASSWHVDLSAAVATLETLLTDSHHRVRNATPYAIGNVAKKTRNDLSRCIPLLRRNIQDEDLYVREASAWALGQLSRRKHDISSALPELVWLLADTQEYNVGRKVAARALLHHAKKSSQNARDVAACVQSTSLAQHYREVERFLDSLDKLT